MVEEEGKGGGDRWQMSKEKGGNDGEEWNGKRYE